MTHGGDTIRIPGSAVPGDGRQPTMLGGGDITAELVQTDVWSDEMVARSGIPVVNAAFVEVGGGIGSFVTADVLRIAGVPTSSIAVLGAIEFPWQTYEYLTRVSQIPRGERLRSDSGSTPGCFWGFPGYSVREAFQERRPTKIAAPLWQVLTEPILTDYFTPRAGMAFLDMERESGRIGWSEMVANGQVRMVRRRSGGGYFTILTPPHGTAATRRVAYRSTWVHLAVGYPGLKYLPDLQAYRQRYADHTRVVNAYEPHEHVYEELIRRGGTVVVRGGGIVASRVLQRLVDDHDRRGAQTQILHLFRTYIDGAHGPNVFMRRRGGDGWAFQGFNWPKSAWGGQMKSRLERLEGDDRKALYELLGGTTTPRRKLWRQQLDRGRREGFYKTFVGEVDSVVPGDGQVITRVKTAEGLLEIPANYVIDATGLEADIREHRLLADLMDHSGAGRNPLGRLDVERNFEVRGTRSAPGKLYASGAATLGGYFAGVDTFLGLQYAALHICDDLAAQGFCKRMGPGRSVSQWWKWARNRRI